MQNFEKPCKIPQKSWNNPLTNRGKYVIICILLVEVHLAISILPEKTLVQSGAKERDGCRRRLADQGRSGSGK